LAGWLGTIWAKRILQNEGAKLNEALEAIKHELSLEKSSYEHYLDLIIEYYRVFYRHYRSCQRAAHADAHRLPDGSITHTKDEFLKSLDSFLEDWSEKEGAIRLLLPKKAMELHEEAVSLFNRFKDAVEEFDSDDHSRQAKQEAFVPIHDLKTRMEEVLREFLRTEKLLK